MEERSFTLEILAPDGIFYMGIADMVELNTSEGEMGILPGHLSMTIMLKPGRVTIYEPDGIKKRATVQGGFAEILPDKVTILAEGAAWAEEIPKEAP